MALLTQTKFARLWLIFQHIIGGTADKRRLALRHWQGQTNVLEVGCSAGNIAGAFARLPGVRYTGLDVDGAAIKLAQKRFAAHHRLRFLHASAEEHAACGDIYDYILVAGVLHHVDDDMAVSLLTATRGLASDDCRVVISEPEALRPDDNIIFKCFYRLEQGQYLRSRQSLLALAQRAGLEIASAENHDVGTGIPGLPVVARFSVIVGGWPAEPCAGRRSQ
ncbi:Methyltransferase type 12 [Desulfarculus baarsii DSM 2075]|uniref:Methyltransferase type 12 n=1 Tax=Desulfarculus baarsii (strain ATCC 33931 / DSM 2075 / LMG 7858 / VKM B-1802 / 2st14) TaxID=644282 RepID=E1QIY6_DESB2|nr:class I SAM-dependent methyltransferase [Desulfarculus baarsii]ADK85529.1 Methyltransferase type 12 [Desulfarculus baarsii DSM 2075]